MSSAFQWAPVCAFPSPALAFKVHQRRHRCHHPRPGPVAALPQQPIVCSSPNNRPPLFHLKSHNPVWERKAQLDNNGVFFISINLRRPAWVWKVTAERHGNKTRDSLNFKRVRLQAGRCVVTRGAAKQLDGSVDGMKTHSKNLGDAN